MSFLNHDTAHDAHPSITTSARPRPVDRFRNRLIGDRFRVLGRLAVTDMSRVYQGRDEHTGKRVAIKVLFVRDRRPEVLAKYRARFFREAETLLRLTHPHVVQLLDHGIVDDEVPYLVMEFLEGNTLRTILKHTTPTPGATLAIVEYVTRALGTAHELGIVHRDIKPSNLFVSGGLDETAPIHVRLIDFGIAKDLEDSSDLTGHNTIIGTPWYMAPEQTLGDPIDGRTDIYAIGCLLYRLFMGRTPFGDRRGTGVMMAHVTQPVPSFMSLRPHHGLPPVVEWTVRRCLEKNPDNRFANMTELRRALHVCKRALENPAFHPRLELKEGRVRSASRRRSSAEEVPFNTLSFPHRKPLRKREPPSTWTILLRSVGTGFLMGGAVVGLAWMWLSV
jgi:serine/threonine-protein kinase